MDTVWVLTWGDLDNANQCDGVLVFREQGQCLAQVRLWLEGDACEDIVVDNLQRMGWSKAYWCEDGWYSLDEHFVRTEVQR